MIKFDPDKLSAEVRKQLMTVVIQATELVREEAVRLVMNSPRSGRFYHRRGVVHRASAPGEPWASDTGYAVSSIHTHYDPVQLRGTVNIDAEYGPYLEFGTQTMEPRPVLRPALQRMQPQIEQLFNVALTKALG